MSIYKNTNVNNLVMGLAVMLFVFSGYQLQHPLYEGLIFWWDKVGVVMLGLLPLSFALLGVVLYLILEPKSRTSVNMETMLKIISFTAPSLGLLGTVLGTVEGTSAFSLANGVKELLGGVSALMNGLSIALLSTAWGSVIGIPAGVLHIVFFEEATSKQVVESKSPVFSKSESNADEQNDEGESYE